MTKLKAILVDDEPRARNVLENLLHRFCPDVDVVDKCPNVPEAVEAIRLHRPDLVLLDIEMPKFAGFELVKFFDEVDFEIIFVTAYDQFALRAFELAAVDYLLKPVDINRLKQAIARVQTNRDRIHRLQRMATLNEALQGQKVANLIINDRGQQHVLPLESIVAFEAQAAYCNIHFGGKVMVASKNLKHFETMLEPSIEFLRVHKSWLINRIHVEHYSVSEMLIQLKGGVVAKLSKYQKAEFEAAIRT
jgi:two-component system LytT family response regulator